MTRHASPRPVGRRGGLYAALLLIVLGWAAGTSYGQVGMVTQPRGVAPETNLDIREGQLMLSLEDALEIALGRNLNLLLNRYDRRSFGLGVEQAQGIFDLLLNVDGSWSDTSSPPVTALQASNSDVRTLNASASQLDPFGGVTTLTFDNGRRETDLQFNNFNPAYSSEVGIGYRLPLLRNFGPLATKRNILVARLRDDGNRAFYEQQIATTLQNVENAYWGLVEARAQLGVAEEALRLAQELHRRNEVQVDVGTMPPLELVRSDANTATRREEIIVARTNVGNAEDQLRLLLNLDQGPAWNADIVPVTEPVTEDIEVELEDAIAIALKERPELAQQNAALEELDLDTRYFANQLKPQLDLTAGYGYAGTFGDRREVDSETGETTLITGAYSDAVQQILDREFDGWNVGLSFTMPLQNRSARAQKAIADIELERGKVNMTLLQQQIITEVRTAVRQVRAARQQIESATIAEQLQLRNLEAEQKRYENGMSTSFEVTQVQEDLTLARSRQVNSVASYRRALAEYYRAIGRLLDESGVLLVDPDEDEDLLDGM